MSSFHEQAMRSVYRQVVDRVCCHMSRGQQASLQLLIQRLTVAAGGLQHIDEFQFLVVQGGDRRSAHLLACLRAAQLSLAVRDGKTFRLRVLVCCLPVLGSQTLIAHERIFDALFMQGDPRVDLLMLEDDKVVPFTRRPAEVMSSWAGAREALLMFGHITGAVPEALLGCRVHLQLADALRWAIEGGGASALVTALPDRQRRRFMAWGRRVLRLAGAQGCDDVHQCAAALAERLGHLQMWVGSPLGRSISVPTATGREQPVQVLTVDDLLCPLTEERHLDAMLDLHPALAAPSLPLSSWAEPSLVANLSRLRAHLLTSQGRWHDEGLSLKDARTGWWLKAQQQGRASFLQGLGVDEAQLSCLLSAPFAEQGRNLAHFLRGCHPRMRVALPYLHRALQGKPCPEAIKRWLMEVSGLSLAQLQAVYAGRHDSPAGRVLAYLARRDAALQWLPWPACAPAAVRQAAY